MKTFSFSNLFTLICFACLTLMLVGNTAEAQEAGLKVIFEEIPAPLQIVDGAAVTSEFTVQLVNKDGDGVNGVPIDFSAIPSKSATFSMDSVDTATVDGTMGIAKVTVTIIEAGTITVRGTVNLSGLANRVQLEADGIINDAFAGHDYRVVDVVKEPVPVDRPVDRVPPESTTIVVLPPIPCDDPADDAADHKPLSELVDLTDLVERVGTTDNTPASLSEIQTHAGLLKAIETLEDKLGDLAAWGGDPNYSATPPNVFRVPIVILNAEDLAGWQFDVAYNPQILEVVEVTAGEYAIFEGDFLEQGSAPTFFQQGSVQPAFGNVIRISQARLTEPLTGADGTGELVSICFKVKEFAEESLGLHNVQLSDETGERLDYTSRIHPVVVTHQFPPEDVNRDGKVTVEDLIVVAANLGLAKPINPRTDVNKDGIVNVLDIIMVAKKINDPTPPTDVRDPNMAAPTILASVESLDSATIQGWIDMAQVEDDGSAIFDLGIANLEALMASRTPSETKLLLNYPNPFNPETWIPYQLAESTEVTISIYAVNGNLVRTLALGHQAAGVYHSKSQAAYWNGRNALGERVASGVYFYTFTAGKFSATGKMLVRK